jgi:hypothetical protein
LRRTLEVTVTEAKKATFNLRGCCIFWNILV